MKHFLLITLTFVFLLLGSNVDAQKKSTKVHKGKQGQKTVIHKNKKGKKTLVHKGKKGNKTAIHKGKKGKVYTHKTHKRVKRTRVVHHHYRHLPKRGLVVNSVHSNSLSIRFGGIGYRFHSGVWYKPHGAKWMVSRPSYGMRIQVLPVGYRTINIGQRNYFYYYGTYYVNTDKAYEVVEAPIGAEIGSLPDGSNTVEVDGNIYYVLDGIYYIPSLNEDGEEVLIVVENPT